MWSSRFALCGSLFGISRQPALAIWSYRANHLPLYARGVRDAHTNKILRNISDTEIITMQRSATAKPCSPAISGVGFFTDRPDTAVTELSVKWGPLWLVIQLRIQIRRVTSIASMILDARPHNGGEVDENYLEI